MRQYRDLDDEVKQKISTSSKGKSKSYDHKLHISQAMKKYWDTIPYKDGRKTNNDQNQGTYENKI